MLKILVFIGLTTIYASQKPENVTPIANEQNKISFSKAPIITANPDYLKIKSQSKLVNDVDIDDVIAQKLMSNYSVGDIKKIFETDQMINIFMLLGRLSIILIMFVVLWKAINRFTVTFVNSVVKRTHRNSKYTDTQALTNTAGPILNSILHWTLICVTLLIVLAEMDVKITPIIYSFGVFGLAISIGAQTLVRDIISGIITLFEGIISIGEIVELNGQLGTIEAMSLRAIEFRHSNGKMQVIAFSEISSLLNLSRDYSICNIVLPVAHDADLSEVEEMFKDIFDVMKSEDSWKDLIIGELNLAGVVSITETAVYTSCLAQTQPDPYDLFGKEFRKRLHLQMQKRKIPAPKFTSVIMKS
jgi:small-conductance mechanosensitive channel